MDRVGFLAELKGKDQVLAGLQEIVSAMNKINGTNINIKAATSGLSQLQSEAKMVTKEIDNINSRRIRFQMDKIDIGRHMDEAIRKIRELENRKIKLSADSSEYKRVTAEIERLQKQIETLRSLNVRINGLEDIASQSQNASGALDGIVAKEDEVASHGTQMAMTVSDALNMMSKGFSGLGDLFDGLGNLFGGKIVDTAKTTLSAYGTLAVRNALSGSIERYDTMKLFPKRMKRLGYDSAEAEKTVDMLEQAVIGLPTSLNEIVSSAQELIPLAGDLQKGARLAIAVNNAFLAGGSDATQARYGQRQIRDLLAARGLRTTEWDSLFKSLGAGLGVIATEMGYSGKAGKKISQSSEQLSTFQKRLKTLRANKLKYEIEGDSKKLAKTTENIAKYEKAISKLEKKQHKDLGTFRNDLKSGAISAEEFTDALIAAGSVDPETGKKGTLVEWTDDIKANLSSAGKNVGIALQKTVAESLNALNAVLISGTGKDLAEHIVDISTGIKEKLIPAIQGWIFDNKDKIIDFFNRLKNYDWMGLLSTVGKNLAKYYDMFTRFYEFFSPERIGKLAVWAKTFGKIFKVVSRVFAVLAGFKGFQAISMFAKLGRGKKVADAVNGVSQFASFGDAVKNAFSTFINATAYLAVIAEAGLVIAELGKVASYVSSLDLSNFGKNMKPLTAFAGSLATFVGVLVGVMKKFGTKDLTMLAGEGLAAGFVGIMGEMGVVIHEIAGVAQEIANLDLSGYEMNAEKVKRVMSDVIFMAAILTGTGGGVSTIGGGIGAVFAGLGELLAAGFVDIMAGIADVMHEFVKIVDEIANADTPDTRKMDAVGKAIGNLKQYVFEPINKLSVSETSRAEKKMKHMADALKHFEGIAKSLNAVKKAGNIGVMTDRIGKIMDATDIIIGHYNDGDEKDAKVAAGTLKQTASAAKSIKTIAKTFATIQESVTKLTEAEKTVVPSARGNQTIVSTISRLDKLKRDTKRVIDAMTELVKEFEFGSGEIERGQKNIDAVSKAMGSIQNIVKSLTDSKAGLEGLLPDAELNAGKSTIANRLGILLTGIAAPFKALGEQSTNQYAENYDVVADFKAAKENINLISQSMQDISSIVKYIMGVKDDINALMKHDLKTVPSARGNRNVEQKSVFDSLKTQIDEMLKQLEDIFTKFDNKDIQTKLNRANIGMINIKNAANNLRLIVGSFTAIQSDLTRMGENGRFGAGSATSFSKSGIKKGLIKDEAVTVIKRMIDAATEIKTYMDKGDVDINDSLVKDLGTINSAITPIGQIITSVQSLAEPMSGLKFDKEGGFELGKNIVSVMTSVAEAFAPLISGEVDFDGIDEIAGQFSVAADKLPNIFEKVSAIQETLNAYTFSDHDTVWTLGRKLKAVMDGLTAAFSGMNALENGTGEGANLSTAAEKLGQINTVLKEMGDAGGTIFALQEAYTNLKTAIDNVGSACDDVRQKIAQLKAAFEGFAKYLSGYKSQIQPGLDAMNSLKTSASQISGAFDAAVGSVNALADAINNLPTEKTVNVRTTGGSYSYSTRNVQPRHPHAVGGVVHGRGGIDNVPAWLTSGEFVMRKAAHNKFGTAFMHRINNLDVDGAIRALSIRAGAGVFNKGGVVTNNYSRDSHSNFTWNIHGASQGFTQRRASKWARAYS